VSRGESTAFGDLLRGHRRAAGLSQSALAEAAGLSEQAIGHLERGVRRRPYRATVLALAAALGLDANSGAVLLAAARGWSGTAVGAAVSRHQLPAAVPDFVGRSEELDQLADRLREAGSTARARPVAVHGPAGVGKTTLAVRAAHLAANDFVDGQLYLDLRGYGSGEPMTAAAALTVLLSSLGVAKNAVPASVDAAAAQYRALLGGTRTLIVLDNVSDTETLNSLLPDAEGCAVLVTGRRMLEPASIELRPLDDADCLDLFERIVGSQRVGADLESAQRIVRTSHGLPLIVRLVGARLESRASWPLTVVADQFDELGIDHLGVADAVHHAVATSLHSLRQSTDVTAVEAAIAFDFLGLLEGHELTAAAIGALLDRPAEDVMVHLVALHLVASPRPGVYQMHDLLHAVATERAAQILRADERDDALRRVVELYLTAAWECQSLSHPSSERLRFARTPIGALDPESLPQRLEWLDAESAVIMAVVEQLATLPGSRDLLIELGFALFGYLEIRGRKPELRRVAVLCRAAARSVEQRVWFEYQAAIPDWEQGLLDEALTGFSAALALSEQIGDARSVSRCAFAVARTLERLDRIDEAVPVAQRSIASAEESGYQQGLEVGLLALGALQARRGEVPEAEASFNRTIQLALDNGERRVAARRHGNAGDVYVKAGLYAEALVHLRSALRLYDGTTDAHGVFFAQHRLGTSLLALDRPEEARVALEAALRVPRDRLDDGDEARLLMILAEVRLRQGDVPAAIRDLTVALSLSAELSDPEVDEIRQRLTTLEKK